MLNLVQRLRLLVLHETTHTLLCKDLMTLMVLLAHLIGLFLAGIVRDLGTQAVQTSG